MVDGRFFAPGAASGATIPISLSRGEPLRNAKGRESEEGRRGRDASRPLLETTGNKGDVGANHSDRCPSLPDGCIMSGEAGRSEDARPWQFGVSLS